MNVYYATIEPRQYYDVGCNKKKTKQNKTKQNKKKKKKKNITPAAMRHQHQMYMRFPHCTMYEMKKDKLSKDYVVKGQKTNRTKY